MTTRDGQLVGAPTSNSTSEGAMAELADLVIDLADIPLPGSGNTWLRWRYLMTIAARDASLGRLVEGHLDALAILDELGRADLASPRWTWGVWAAQPDRLRAERTAAGWHLTGSKGWCSGSAGLQRALLTATAVDGPRLFVVDPRQDGVSVRTDSWTPLGMAPTFSETLDIDLEIASACAVGEPNEYVQRVGFHHGGAGVAACWFGATSRVVAGLAENVGDDPHRAARWGAVRARMEAVGAHLQVAAGEIDSSPADAQLAERLARSVRIATEEACRRSIADVVVALGATGLTHHVEHHRRVADAMVYLRQLHPDTDAEYYGRMGGDLLRW